MAKNLGQVSALYKGTTEPTNTEILWYNQSNYITYYHNGSAWIPLTSGDTYKVVVSTNDAPGYLEDKLISGPNIGVATIGGVGDEKIQFSYTGATTDQYVKVSALDTAGYLEDKLVAGTNITLISLGAPGDETIQINFSGVTDDKYVAVSALDTAGYLEDKLVAGDGINIQTAGGIGDEHSLIQVSAITNLFYNIGEGSQLSLSDDLYVQGTSYLDKIELGSNLYHNGSVASGNKATALGAGNFAYGIASTTMGLGTAASGTSQLVIGRYNIGNGHPIVASATSKLFIVGNGVNDMALNNVLTVTFGGTVFMGSEAENSGVQITQSGLTLIGSATTWDDLRIDVANVSLPASQTPSWVEYGGGRVLGFSNDQTNTIYFSTQMPHTYKERTPIHFHLHLIGPESGGDVVWLFNYTWTNIGDTMGTTITGQTITTLVGGERHETHEILELNHTDKEISSILICKLSRLGTNNDDTLEGDAYLIGADFHYEIDSLGSNDEYVK